MINLSGYFGDELFGLKLTSLGWKRALESSFNISYSDISQKPPLGDIIIIHGSPQDIIFYIKINSLILKDKKIVCIPYWESINPVKEIYELTRYCDEIWLSSSYLFNNFKRFIKDYKNIREITQFIPIDIESKTLSKDSKGILFIFDGFDWYRKGVDVLIDIFKALNREDVYLTLKTHRFTNKELLEEIKLLKINLINERYERGKIKELFNNNFIYASLHRGEGFGLTPIEALNFGNIPIFTNVGGLIDFFPHDYPYKISYGEIRAKVINPPAREGDIFAEPKKDMALKLLIDILENKEKAKKESLKAKEFFKEKNSIKEISKKIKEAITSLNSNKDKDFDSFIKDYEKIKGNTLIFGTKRLGVLSYNVLKSKKDINIIGFVDDTLEGKFLGYPVFKSHELKDISFDSIVLGVGSHTTISKIRSNPILEDKFVFSI